MKTLSIRSKTLLLNGAKICGNFTDGFGVVEESLYSNEAVELREFCEWVDKNVGGAGSVNIDTLFKAFKNPTDKELQLFVKELSDKIKFYRSL